MRAQSLEYTFLCYVTARHYLANERIEAAVSTADSYAHERISFAVQSVFALLAFSVSIAVAIARLTFSAYPPRQVGIADQSRGVRALSYTLTDLQRIGAAALSLACQCKRESRLLRACPEESLSPGIVVGVPRVIN
jgi:hypothetical protein